MTYRNNRSVPNRGEQCGLYVLGNSSPVGRPLVTRFNETVMCAGQGEDYSNSAWPIVVKVKRGVGAEQLARHLEDLAAQVRAGYFVDVDPDADDDVWPAVEHTPAGRSAKVAPVRSHRIGERIVTANIECPACEHRWEGAEKDLGLQKCPACNEAIEVTRVPVAWSYVLQYAATKS